MAAARELRVYMGDQPGKLGSVSSILGDAGVNIDGFGVWNGTARLFVTDIDRAAELLREAGYECEVGDVLRLHVPDEPGNLAEVAKALGEAGINIDYAYTLTSIEPGSADFVLAVVDIGAAEDLVEE